MRCCEEIQQILVLSLCIILISLVNIYKELTSDIDGFQAPKHGYLMGWAKQGEFSKL